jgi:hypothetical protein
MIQKMWCCIQDRPDGDRYRHDTLSYQKKTSIEKLMDGATLLNWKKCRRSHGWRCVKVELIIKEVKTIDKKP